MSETLAMKIAVGDEVRVHFHPPGPWKSFSEGVVRRVDVTTQAGRFFVLEIRNEVILDQPHRIRPGSPDYVQYECRNDFPGRIEILSEDEQPREPNAVEPATNHGSEIEPAIEAELVPEPRQEQDEQQTCFRRAMVELDNPGASLPTSAERASAKSPVEMPLRYRMGMSTSRLFERRA
jgi:hypothetical protein